MVRFMHRFEAAERLRINDHSREDLMIEPVLFIHILSATLAVLCGLGSRNFATALVSGLFVGLLHGGLIALLGAKANVFEIAEQPHLNIAADYAMNTGYLTFPHARYVTYLVICGLALLLATVAAWIVRFILCSIVCAILPKDTPASQET
jgi:hypothetical protein